MNLGGEDTAIAIASCITVLMALSFYLPIVTGALFIVPIASMGTGAYVASELAMHGHSLIVVYLAGALAGAVVALVGGALVVRMSTWSAAIASLAIVEVIQVIFENYGTIGGSSGLYGVPLFTALTSTLILTAIVVVALVCLDLSYIGDVMEAIRGDELAAECSGLRVTRLRLTLFSASGLLAGLGGTISAGYLGFVDPSTYGFSQLNNFLLAVIFGGSTTAVGPVFGGIMTNALPSWLNWAQTYTLIAFSLVVIIVMLFRRQGVITKRIVKRAYHAICRVLRVGPGRKKKAEIAGVGRLPRYLSRRPHYTTWRAVGMTKSFGGAHAVSGVDIELKCGQVVGIIGAIGAGKTTLINLLTGVIQADKGMMTVENEEKKRTVRKLRPGTAVSMGIARTFQNGKLFPGLTSVEHVSLIRGSNGPRLLERVGLLDQSDVIAKSLSYGDQRLVEIARALATEPQFLVVDEPTAGMTKQEAHRVLELISQLRATGLGILVIDHNVDFISGVCDHLIAMDFGKIIAEGNPEDVLKNPQVIEAYLGVVAMAVEEDQILTSKSEPSNDAENAEGVSDAEST